MGGSRDTWPSVTGWVGQSRPFSAWSNYAVAPNILYYVTHVRLTDAIKTTNSLIYLRYRPWIFAWPWTQLDRQDKLLNKSWQSAMHEKSLKTSKHDFHATTEWCLCYGIWCSKKSRRDEEDLEGYDVTVLSESSRQFWFVSPWNTPFISLEHISMYIFL